MSIITLTVVVTKGTGLSGSEPFFRCSFGDLWRDSRVGTRSGGQQFTFNARLEFVIDKSKLPQRPSLTLLMKEHSRFFDAKDTGNAVIPLRADELAGIATGESKTLIVCKDVPLSPSGSIQIDVRASASDPEKDSEKLRYKQAIGMLKVRVVGVANPDGPAHSSPIASAVSFLSNVIQKKSYFVEVCHGMLKYTTRKHIAVAPQSGAETVHNVTFDEDIRFWLYDDTQQYEVQFTLYEEQGSTVKQLGRGFLSIGELKDHGLGENGIGLHLACGSAAGVSDRDARFFTEKGMPLPCGVVSSLGERELSLRPSFSSKSDVEATFLEGLWQRFDLDGNGTLSEMEVAAMMDTIRFPMTNEELQRFMKLVDADYDGTLSREEFTRLFHSEEFQSNPMSAHMISFVMDGPAGVEHMIYGISDRVTMQSLNQTGGIGQRLLFGSLNASKQASSVDIKVATLATATGVDEDDMGLIVFERCTGLLLHENIPGYIKVALKSMYRTGFGQKMTETSQIRAMLVQQSRAEGVKMDHPSSKEKILPFIETYGLDINEFKVPVDSYPHFNAFFYRQLVDGARPITAPEDDSIIVSCADCRMSVFPNILDSTTVWIKGSEFTVEKLLGPKAADLAASFLGCTLAIARLAPQDYHRFHFPATCRVISVTEVSGTLYTVNPIAVRQPVNVYTENVRHVAELESPKFGKFVMIAVGATMVGSINWVEGVRNTPGKLFQKGDEAGYFAFGGSTVLMMFPRGTMVLDEDLVTFSQKPIEVLVRMGTRIGVAK